MTTAPTKRQHTVYINRFRDEVGSNSMNPCYVRIGSRNLSGVFEQIYYYPVGVALTKRQPEVIPASGGGQLLRGRVSQQRVGAWARRREAVWRGMGQHTYKCLLHL